MLLYLLQPFPITMTHRNDPLLHVSYVLHLIQRLNYKQMILSPSLRLTTPVNAQPSPAHAQRNTVTSSVSGSVLSKAL